MLLNKFLFARLTFVLVVLALQVHAQTIPVLSGNVKTASGEAIPGASVSVKKTSAGTTSDANGYFSIQNLKPGKYNLEITAIGFQKISENVLIQTGKPVTINFNLKETQTDLNEVQVVGKTETQEIKEQAFTVNSIETRQFANTTADLNLVLNKTAGVRVREEGGMGSDINFSINGLSGKADSDGFIRKYFTCFFKREFFTGYYFLCIHL